MLLKVGTIMMAVALTLALGVAVLVGLRSGEPETASSSAPVESTDSPGMANGPSGSSSPSTRPERGREAKTLPVVRQDWPRPSDGEVAAADVPRYYPPQQDAELALTVEAIGLYDVPVIDSGNKEALDRGVIHLPQTPMPWEEREQKNVYIAGHRLGYPDTGSRLVFYNLDKLQKGDTVSLRDREGGLYEYRVSEVFVVEPDADWAVDPVRGRDMVTLQTCTWPNFENRLIVRADRA